MGGSIANFHSFLLIYLFIPLRPIKYAIVHSLLNSTVSPAADGCLSCSTKVKTGMGIDCKLSKTNLLASYCAVHSGCFPSGVNCSALMREVHVTEGPDRGTSPVGTSRARQHHGQRSRPRLCPAPPGCPWPAMTDEISSGRGTFYPPLPAVIIAIGSNSRRGQIKSSLKD